MDITPIYELQNRLRSTSIAGVGLLQEDFRLKRAADAIKQIEGASPVFAKLSQQMTLLLSADCTNPVAVLLDTISLTDAVVCTLGTVVATGEIQDLEIVPSSTATIVNAPHSQVKGLIEALTTSGSGNYAYVQDMHEVNPSIFRDYRVRYAMVQALGASYAELADMVQEWLFQEDDSIVPLLKKDFVSKGKREMLRRLEVIGTIAREKENNFYVSLLENDALKSGNKEMRRELISLLRYDQSNASLLLNLLKTEKGRSKNWVLRSLAYMNDDRICEIYEKLAKKEPETVCEYLISSTTESASRIISQLCMEQMPEILEMEEGDEPSIIQICIGHVSKEYQNSDGYVSKRQRFGRSVEALIGKSGNEVMECYKALLANKEKLGILMSSEIAYDIVTTGYKGWNDKKKRPWEQVISIHLLSSLVIKDNPQIADLVMVQYENKDGEKNDNFLTAAAFVKICSGEPCTEWFDEQLKEGVYSKNQINRLTSIKAALQYIRWDRESHEYVTGGHIQSDFYMEVKRQLKIPHYRAIMDWMMISKWDELLYDWTIKDDAKECAKMGEWFYNRFLDIEKKQAAPSDMDMYLRYMNELKWTKCQRLGEVFVSVRGQSFAKEPWQIREFFRKLPGTREEIRVELENFIRLVEEKKLMGSNTGYLDNIRNEFY